MAARRTQADRSAATQQALVDAAIELLIERGWAATTAVAVCERAGCTRGALVHHYPNLSALLAHALEWLYEDLTAARVGRRNATDDGAASSIDTVWRAVGDPPVQGGARGVVGGRQRPGARGRARARRSAGSPSSWRRSSTDADARRVLT